MVLAQARRLPLEQRHQVLRLRVPGIAARDEDGVDARQLREDLGPLLERELHLLRIAVVLVERGIPDPHVLPVLVGDAATSPPSCRSAAAGSAGCRPHRPTAAGSARSRWSRRSRGRGCTAPTSARPTRRRRWSSAGSRADGRGARPAGSRRRRARRERAATPRVMRSSRSSRPTPKSTPRASAPSTSTVGARASGGVDGDAVSFGVRALAGGGRAAQPGAGPARRRGDRPDGNDGHVSAGH